MNSAKKMTTNICILGGGPAGYVAAIRASQLGASVVLVEEKELGGVCLNVGCIPTKALLKTSETATTIKRSKEFGVESRLDRINWTSAVDRKNKVVKNLTTGVQQLLAAKNVTVIKGRGIVSEDKKMIIQTQEETIEVTWEKLIITTGASPLLPPIKGIDLEGVMTSTDALSMDSLPSQITIIGAGVIGLEFASMFTALGVKITVLELLDRILPGEDSEMSSELLKIMKRQGIAIKLSVKVTDIKKTEEGLTVTYFVGDKEVVKPCEKVLVAVGRKLNMDSIQNLPLKIEKNAIAVNDHMETNIRGIYAAGDIVGGKQLAHLAFMEGKAAAQNALGISSKVNYTAVPSCIYTNPEVASVGMTQEAAENAGISVKVGQFNLRSNGRAQTLGDREGFVKVIADQNNTIIGAQILGVHASEMISELTLAVTLKAKADDIADMIHPHPALSEAIWEACGDLLGRAIHKI